MAQDYIKLAQTLPPRLLRFFARYPPPSAAFSNRAQSSIISTALHNSSSDPDDSHIESTIPPSSSPPSYTNPFARTRNSITGKWHDPLFSLRRQADLLKLARANGIEDLLPPSTKSAVARLQKRAETGLRVKGTGVGQRVKGKKWERTQKGKLEKRRQAMLGMPRLVQEWKQMGHGRGWKKWPK